MPLMQKYLLNQEEKLAVTFGGSTIKPSQFVMMIQSKVLFLDNDRSKPCAYLPGSLK